VATHYRKVIAIVTIKEHCVD